MITMVPLEETVAVQQIVARKLQQAEAAAKAALLRAERIAAIREKRAEKRAEEREVRATILALEERLGLEKSDPGLLKKQSQPALRAKFQALLALITAPAKTSLA